MDRFKSSNARVNVTVNGMTGKEEKIRRISGCVLLEERKEKGRNLDKFGHEFLFGVGELIGKGKKLFGRSGCSEGRW